MSRSIWVQMRFVAFSLWGHPYHDFSLIRRPPCVWAPLFGSNMWNPSRSVYSDEVFLVTSERPQYYQQSALWLCLKTNISMFVEQQLESRWISFFPGREVSAFLSTSLKPREKTPMCWNHPNRNAEGLGAICAYVLVALVVSVAPVGNLDVWGSWQLRCWMAHIVLLTSLWTCRYMDIKPVHVSYLYTLEKESRLQRHDHECSSWHSSPQIFGSWFQVCHGTCRLCEVYTS